MKREELDTLQKKVDELRAVLLFGKRALPFLEDIFEFVQQIIPVVEELKQSVDATSEKLPRASKQLDKVTHATELASTEILNTLETMFGKLEEMSARYREQQQRASRVAETMQRVNAAVDGLGANGAAPEVLGALREAWRNHCASLWTPEDGFPETLQGLQSDCTNIMIALQVQDITAQQIAAVNRLMQSVDEGLNKLMQHFSQVPSNANPSNYNHAHLDIQFDVAAEYVGVEDRQKAADALIESAQVAKDAGKNGNS
jgi:chemotaxis regulatin CheY-phosphate phosphatase CheZ